MSWRMGGGKVVWFPTGGIRAVFTLAREKGIDRMMVSHAGLVIGADPEPQIADVGALLDRTGA